jgi:hypothetical protein
VQTSFGVAAGTVVIVSFWDVSYVELHGLSLIAVARSERVCCVEGVHQDLILSGIDGASLTALRFDNFLTTPRHRGFICV